VFFTFQHIAPIHADLMILNFMGLVKLREEAYNIRNYLNLNKILAVSFGLKTERRSFQFQSVDKEREKDF